MNPQDLIQLLETLISNRKGTAESDLNDIGKNPRANSIKDLTNDVKSVLGPLKELEATLRQVNKVAKAQEREEQSAAATAGKANLNRVRQAVREKKAAEKDAEREERNFGLANLARIREAVREKKRAARELEREKARAEKEAEKGEGVTMGRLPLASIPAMLRGNTSAGARVGYALGEHLGMGKFAGLGIGAGAAGIIGAGFAGSPNGSEVITGPLKILAGTIGGYVLPSLVKFGAAILDLADWIEGKTEKGMTPEQNKRIEQTGGAIAGGGLIMGALLGAPFGPLGMLVGGALGAAGGYYGGKKAATALEDKDINEAARNGDPNAQAQLRERKQAKLDSLGNQKLLLQDMLANLGGQPKMGNNILDIARNTQQATFESPMEIRQRRMFLENMDRVTKEIQAVEKAIRGE